MKARKLKSGNWNITVYNYTDGNGKRRYESFTAPTKAEAEYMAADFKRNRVKKKPHEMTVESALRKYIELSELLSPTTIKSYESILAHAFQDLMPLKIAKLSDEIMQNAINTESLRKTPHGKQLSPKTVCCEYGLISTALYKVCGLKFDVRLPKKVRNIKQYPEPETVIGLIKGTEIELPCMLALWLSFSMSEIKGIKCSSINNGIVTIDQVMVYAGTEIVKPAAKVDTRNRAHRIPKYIMDLIENTEVWIEYQETGEDGYIVPFTRNQLHHRFSRLMSANKIDLSFHDLRHLSASVMLALNIPEKYAMERGGWKTPHVMKSIYQHTFSNERRLVDDTIDAYFSEHLQNKNAK